MPEKEDFYSKLNMEDTDADYTHAKRVSKDLEIKNLENIMISMFKVIHCCWQMYLRTLKISVFKYMNFTLLLFLLH